MLPNLVTVIRGLLIEHDPTGHDGCPVRAVPWPCPVISTVHGLLSDPCHEYVELIRRRAERRGGSPGPESSGGPSLSSKQ